MTKNEKDLKLMLLKSSEGFLPKPMRQGALLKNSFLRRDFPPSLLNSGHADDLSGIKRIGTVNEVDADLDFGSLAVSVSRSDAFTEYLDAPDLGLDPASDVISGPALPERPSMMLGSTQRFIASDCGRAVFFPRPAALEDRDDWSGLAVDDGSLAPARIIGPVGGNRADVLTFRDLTEQLQQNQAVAIATGGKFHGADVRSGCVHCKMDLAPE